MLFNLKIEGIITHNIFIERNIVDWDEYKENILNNLNAINFNLKIKDYISSGKLLYVSRIKLRQLLYNSIVLNNNIFMEVGYNKFEFKNEYTIYDIYDFIEICVKILVKKQQLKD